MLGDGAEADTEALAEATSAVEPDPPDPETTGLSVLQANTVSANSVNRIDLIIFLSFIMKKTVYKNIRLERSKRLELLTFSLEARSSTIEL